MRFPHNPAAHSAQTRGQTPRFASVSKRATVVANVAPIA
jgi:hypothetical protein